MIAIASDKLKPEIKTEEIISRAQDGDKTAFAELVRLYQKKVFKMAYGYFMNRDDAMEIVQETFLKAFKALGTLRDNSRFESWLYRIATNLSHNLYRKRKNTIHLGNEENEVGKLPEYSVRGIEFDIELDRRSLKVKKAIDALTHRQKTIIIMKYYQEMKFKEIADILGISIGTTKKHHFRALKKLQDNSEAFLKDR